MDREIHHQAAGMGYSSAGNLGLQGYESHEFYNPQATSAAYFHRSFEQQLPSITSFPQQNFSFQDGKFFSAQTAVSVSQRLKLCKYLFPAQELLNEFCDLGGVMRNSKNKSQSRRLEEKGATSSACLMNQYSLKSLDMLELQKRKAKLLALLEEVERRYKRYCEQMRAVVSSFEAVAGKGAATVYLALASKTMSRHFRSLRDGIVEQMQDAKKAMGEKDTSEAAAGKSRGETPRLKLLDQSFRQHKAFQQGSIFMDQQPWRPQRGLPDRSVSILRAWLFQHFLHPYPSDVDKHILARQTGLSRSQVTNWFINARVRIWKPMIEEIYLEEMKEGEENPSRQAQQDDRNPNPTFSLIPKEQKPPPAELLSEADSLSSIINADRRGFTNPRSFNNYQTQVQRTEHFGVADLDFSSYYGCSSQSYSGDGVSLTLGLQHHDGGGAGGGFTLSPANHQQFTMIDGEVQKLSYRNLMGAQMLHDFAG